MKIVTHPVFFHLKRHFCVWAVVIYVYIRDLHIRLHKGFINMKMIL